MAFEGLIQKRRQADGYAVRPEPLLCIPTVKLVARVVNTWVGNVRRKGSTRLVGHRLSVEERQRILLTCNQPEYASLPQVR